MPLQSINLPPGSIYDFREIKDSQILHIPELPQNRKCTNKCFLFFFIMTILLTAVLVFTTYIVESDYNRFLHGYDKCGNTCGAKNRRIRSRNCSGKNLVTKPIMKYQFLDYKNRKYLLPDECVAECKSPDRLLFHRCVPQNDRPVHRKGNKILTFLEFVDDLHKSGIILVLPMCFLGGVFVVGLFVSFYFSSRWTVITILVLSSVCFVSFSGFAWYWYSRDIKQNTVLYFAISMTVASFFLCIFICYFHAKYHLVIGIFIEATNVIFAIPSLILVPLTMIFVLTVLVTASVFLVCILSTNQSLQPDRMFPTINDFQITKLAQAGISYVILTMIWIFAFANACQCFIVAGPVSQYYFQKDDTDLKSSVARSVSTLFRYHLGSVAFGSMCVTLVTVIRQSIQSLENNTKCGRSAICVRYCLAWVEPTVEYLTKKAYIQTAMHGTPLYKSGKRAARLIWANLIDTLTVDIVVYFVLGCAIGLAILLASVVALVAYWVFDLKLYYVWSVLFFGVGIVGTILYFFLQILDVAVQTIFICFCEDKLLNDGKTRPYSMSPSLKLLVDKARNV